MLFAGLLGARKKVPVWRVGRATTWMRGHLWLGLLSFPFILFHSGFSLGAAPLTRTLMVLFIIVVASGIVGAVLQEFIPRVITARVPMETVYEQIDSVCKQLDEEAATVGAELCSALEGDLQFANQTQRAEAAAAGTMGGLTFASALGADEGFAKTMRTFLDDEMKPYLLQDGGRGRVLADKERTSAMFRQFQSFVSARPLASPGRPGKYLRGKTRTGSPAGIASHLARLAAGAHTRVLCLVAVGSSSRCRRSEVLTRATSPNRQEARQAHRPAVLQQAAGISPLALLARHRGSSAGRGLAARRKGVGQPGGLQQRTGVLVACGLRPELQSVPRAGRKLQRDGLGPGMSGLPQRSPSPRAADLHSGVQFVPSGAQGQIQDGGTRPMLPASSVTAICTSSKASLSTIRMSPASSIIIRNSCRCAASSIPAPST